MGESFPITEQEIEQAIDEMIADGRLIEYESGRISFPEMLTEMLAAGEIVKGGNSSC